MVRNPPNPILTIKAPTIFRVQRLFRSEGIPRSLPRDRAGAAEPQSGAVTPLFLRLFSLPGRMPPEASALVSEGPCTAKTQASALSTRCPEAPLVGSCPIKAQGLTTCSKILASGNKNRASKLSSPRTLAVQSLPRPQWRPANVHHSRHFWHSEAPTSTGPASQVRRGARPAPRSWQELRKTRDKNM